MPPESIMGTGLAIVLGLVGVIWAMLQTKISAQEKRTTLIEGAVGDLRVRLASEYHDTDESRQLVQDLIAPLKDQLNRIELLMLRVLNKQGES